MISPGAVKTGDKSSEGDKGVTNKDGDFERWSERASLALFILALAYYLWAVSIGWNNTITDRFGFRQTQTALTAFYMVHEPFKLAYETPFLGPPWTVPLEFPLFQWCAAQLVKDCGLPLDQCGRLLSVSFFLLILIPGYFLLGIYRVRRPHRLLALSLLLVSPFYIFWSRTFMMETCALFFCITYLACSLGVLEGSGRTGIAILGCVCGVLGALLKITTFIPCVGFVGLYVLCKHIRLPLRIPTFQESRALITEAVLFGVGPMAAGIWWTRFADNVKRGTPVGRYLISSSASIIKWNFGTLGQKLSLSTWHRIFSYIPSLFTSFNHATLLVLVGLIILAVSAWFHFNPRLKAVLVCIALYLFGPALFTNLFFVHDYYSCANGIFLIAAVAFYGIGMLENQLWNRVGFVLMVEALAMGICGHQELYVPIQRKNFDTLPRFARMIRNATSQNAVNVIVSSLSDPTLPYYSERRTLMVPVSGEGVLPTPDLRPDLRQTFSSMRGEKLGLIIFAPEARPWKDYVLGMMKEAGLATDRVCVLNGTPDQWTIDDSGVSSVPAGENAAKRSGL